MADEELRKIFFGLNKLLEKTPLDVREDVVNGFCEGYMSGSANAEKGLKVQVYAVCNIYKSSDKSKLISEIISEIPK